MIAVRLHNLVPVKTGIHTFMKKGIFMIKRKALLLFFMLLCVNSSNAFIEKIELEGLPGKTFTLDISDNLEILANQRDDGQRGNLWCLLVKHQKVHISVTMWIQQIKQNLGLYLMRSWSVEGKPKELIETDKPGLALPKLDPMEKVMADITSTEEVKIVIDVRGSCIIYDANDVQIGKLAAINLGTTQQGAIDDESEREQTEPACPDQQD